MFIIIGVVVLAGLFALNRLMGGSNELYVVNYTQLAAEVVAQNGEKLQLGPNEHAVFDVDKGVQVMTVKLGELPSTEAVFNPDSLSDGRSGTFFFNLAGAGVLVAEEIIYAEDEAFFDTFEGDWSVSTGEEFAFFEDIDYILEEGPEEIVMPTYADYEVKTQLTGLNWSPDEVYSWLSLVVEDDPVETTMKYMETQISLGYEEIYFIESYFDYATNNEVLEQAEAFMSDYGWSQSDWINLSFTAGASEYMWGVSLDESEGDVYLIDDLDEVVIDETNMQLVVSYPLDTTFYFNIQPATDQGFTRGELIGEVIQLYKWIYEEEENTSTIATEAITDEETGELRNTTNGTYGIWGYDRTDLLVSGFSQMRKGDQLYIIPWIYEE